MRRVVVVFPLSATRERIATMLESDGVLLKCTCRSGAEAVRAITKMDGGVVVSAYKLPDMTVDELAEDLKGKAEIVVVASPVSLSMVTSTDVMTVSAPVKRTELLDTVNRALEKANLNRVDKRPPRSDEDRAFIDAAKAKLCADGMTEPQAHAYLQRLSMQKRCKLVVTAKQFLGME